MTFHGVLDTLNVEYSARKGNCQDPDRRVGFSLTSPNWRFRIFKFVSFGHWDFVNPPWGPQYGGQTGRSCIIPRAPSQQPHLVFPSNRAIFIASASFVLVLVGNNDQTSERITIKGNYAAPRTSVGWERYAGERVSPVVEVGVRENPCQSIRTSIIRGMARTLKNCYYKSRVMAPLRNL